MARIPKNSGDYAIKIGWDTFSRPGNVSSGAGEENYTSDELYQAL